jgi:putative acetyltransferase
MIAGLRIIEDDLCGEAVIALLQLHLDELHALFPSESVHALPAGELREDDVTFYAAWDGERLAGCGALKQLDPVHGEIKSMRAAPEYRGRGVGKAILLHLLAEARRRGYARVSLETGTIDALMPARRLYEAHGFARCAPFADYREDPLSVCMTRTL